MEEQKICAHKVILSAASPFFNERFRDGCTCVEKEGTGKDGDDTPSAGDYRDDASLDDAGLDGAGLDGAGLDDVCLADTCLDDTFLHKGSAEGSKDQPVRERPSKDQTVRERPCKNFAGDQTMTSCNIDDQSLDSGHCVVSVTKEENIDPCFSDEPTVSFISDWRVIDAKRATEDETCCDNFSSYTSCDQVESIRSGSEKRKVARSLISRYMDEVLLHTNRTFSRVANKKCIDKGHCSCENDSLPQIYSLENAKQKTTEPQIYEDNPLVYPSVAKREIEKISLTTEYMDEPRSSVNNTPFPCGTNSIEEARGKRSYENTPAARACKSSVRIEIFHEICYRDIDDRKPESERVKEREDWSCDTKEEYRERKIRKKENETTPSCSCKPNFTNYRNICTKRNYYMLTKCPCVCIGEPKEDARKQWVDNLTPYACDTKKENKDFMVPPTRRFDPEKHSRIPRTWPSKSTASSDTKEAKENIMKRPSKTTYSCCTTEEEERINKWPSKPELSSETTEDEERMRKWPSNPILPSRSTFLRTSECNILQVDNTLIKLPYGYVGDTNKGEKIKKWPNHSKPCVCSSDAKKDAERVEKRRSTAACWYESKKATSERGPDDGVKNMTAFCCESSFRYCIICLSILNRILSSAAADTKGEEEVTGKYTGKTVLSDALKEDTEESEAWPSEPICTGSMKAEGEEKISCKCPTVCLSKCSLLILRLFVYSCRVNENFFDFVEGRSRLNWISHILYLNNNFSLSSCLDNIKEAGRYARNRKEIKAAASCPCKFNSTYMLRINTYLIKKAPRDQIGQPKISRTSAGTSIYPRDANEIKDTEDEVPLRKNMSFVCVPEVKEGTIKRLLWKGDTRDDVSIRTCKDVNAFNAKANFGRRWVCEGFNDWAVGPKCGCDVKKDAGYAFTDEIREIPIRKNKSFVCIPEIAAEGIERWTYKNMNTSSYSWSSGRTQGGGGPQWMSSDNDLASNSSTCKCSKCAPKPKMVPNEDDVRDVMFSDAIRKGVKFGNIVNIYSSCGKEYNPFAKYSDGCIPCTSREQKDDNMTAKLTDVCHPFTSDIEENTNEPTKVPVASTVACGVPCIKKGAFHIFLIK
uniref:BTB domain-containing protein n=1 Tax=Glossina pallidipes TaxID=7398 RepID=A0A1A9ZV31_GLOPL